MSSGHISATGHAIHFAFGSKVGFSGSLETMARHSIGPNPRSRPSAASCIILNGHISETVHPVQCVFGSRAKV